MDKKIKVIKSSDALFWYNNYIGWEFTAYREYDDEYLVRDRAGYSNIIKKIDCVVVNIEKESE